MSSLVTNYMPRKRYFLTNPFIYFTYLFIYLFIYLLIVSAVPKSQNHKVRWLHGECTKFPRTTSVIVVWEVPGPDVNLCHDV